MEISCSDIELHVLETVAHAARSLELEAYLIGGFVRDKLLGRATSDMDIVCTGDGIALAHAVAELITPRPNVSFFKNYGTAHIRIAAGDQWFDLEFVGARKESYTPQSRNPQVSPGSIGDDQNRRDFTINAMAVSLNQPDYGRLVDPFDGAGDLRRGLLRTPMAPAATFSDDPLRMMRAIRFATQLEFDIEPAVLEAIGEISERIGIISQERITDELNKIIAARTPSIGFRLLFQTGLLQLIFPQMVDLAGAEYRDGMGHKDNFTHTIQVLDNVARNSTDLWLRWAAILHDIAKPATKRFEEGHGWTFHGHEVVGGRMVPKIFSRLKLPTHDEMRFVKKLVELHLRPISLTRENITDSAIRRLLFDAGDDFDSLMILCDADITSKNRQKVKRYQENFQLVRQRCREVEESDQIRNWQPPVDGARIMEMFGLSPSRPVGLLKDALKDAILDGVIPNTMEDAVGFLISKAEEMGITRKNA